MGGRDEARWITHEYPQRRWKARDGGGGRRGITLFLHPRLAAIYTYILYFCFRSLHPSTTLFPHVSGNPIIHPPAIHRKGRPSPKLPIMVPISPPPPSLRPRLYLPTAAATAARKQAINLSLSTRHLLPLRSIGPCA